MSTFYLYFREGGELLEDMEGSEYPSLAEASAEAITSARELMSDNVAFSVTPDDRRFEIADESGAIVLVVQFEDAVGVDYSDSERG